MMSITIILYRPLGVRSARAEASEVKHKSGLNSREASLPNLAMKRPAAAKAGITGASLKSKGQVMTLDEKIALARSRAMTADQLGDEFSSDDYKKSPPHCLSLPHWLGDQVSAQPAPANPTERVSTHD